MISTSQTQQTQLFPIPLTGRSVSRNLLWDEGHNVIYDLTSPGSSAPRLWGFHFSVNIYKPLCAKKNDGRKKMEDTSNLRYNII